MLLPTLQFSDSIDSKLKVLSTVLSLGSTDSEQNQAIQDSLSQVVENVTDADTLNSFIDVSMQLNLNSQLNSSNKSSATIYSNIISAVQQASTSKLDESNDVMTFNQSGIVGSNKFISSESSLSDGLDLSLGDSSVSNAKYNVTINQIAFQDGSNKILTTLLSDNFISGLEGPSNTSKLLDITLYNEDGSVYTSSNNKNTNLVTFEFPVSNSSLKASSYTCAYVNISANTVQTDGCSNVSPSNEKSTITCQCSHMTPFTTTIILNTTTTTPPSSTTTFGSILVAQIMITVIMVFGLIILI
eukprot:TRINITY_DN1445_c0_g1_i1.p3 TRINITY_DN1445_c0_g1~~TRINITY_DN1445_c0_g1_i1.p3  ORF type:complete len:300 (-),score=45.92 TRINITY_DN1445_c0_g1_i1:32-931(-)